MICSHKKVLLHGWIWRENPTFDELGLVDVLESLNFLLPGEAQSISYRIFGFTIFSFDWNFHYRPGIPCAAAQSSQVDRQSADTATLQLCPVLAGGRGTMEFQQVLFFPTCQVRVGRFYVNSPASFSSFAFSFSTAGPQLQALGRSVPRRARTATSGSK